MGVGEVSDLIQEGYPKRYFSGDTLNPREIRDFRVSPPGEAPGRILKGTLSECGRCPKGRPEREPHKKNN